LRACLKTQMVRGCAVAGWCWAGRRVIPVIVALPMWFRGGLGCAGQLRLRAPGVLVAWASRDLSRLRFVQE
jgi:hypothetical protein